jgi:ketosteroid isomerase-like protein
MSSVTDIVRKCYAAYESKDRAAIEELLAKDFTFTSPIDDHISRAVYFERCWPNSEHIDTIRIEKLFAEGNEAFVQYELSPSNGEAKFRNTEFFTLKEGKITSVEVYFGAETGEETTEAEIRGVVEAWARAIRSKDADGVVSRLTNDPVRFDLAPPLQAGESIKDELGEWFAGFRGDIGYEYRDLRITAATDVAYAHCFVRISGTKVDGELVDVWVRETLCFRKGHDRWLISHVHESVPFYMDGSLKAAVDLKPDSPKSYSVEL